MTPVGRLLSVNVGRPRDVDWDGRTIRTAIDKQPVAGPAMVRTINIDGDDQADRVAHGGEHRAVLVYQIDSYRYWERELDRDDFRWGQFGENLTVDGLADDEVCIGDRYAIGEAVFEVTQPRVTCFRLGIRMAEPRMPGLLVAHRRPGVYLRVLREGRIRAGEEIVRLRVGPERLTVAEVDGLLYLPRRPTRILRAALRIPALSDGWRDSFAALLRDADRPPPRAPAWDGFVPLAVAAVTRESATITSLTLRPREPPRAGGAVAGQYLTVRLPILGEDGRERAVLRSYSVSRIDPDGYRISVKREPEGVGSGFLHSRVHVGDTVDAAAPRGEFTLRDGTGPVVLASAGVGATPVLAMLRALAADRDGRPVWWLHGARDRARHAFGPEVDGLLAALADGHRVVAYSRPAAGEQPGPGAPFDVVGRIGIETITAAGVPLDADWYLCGPAAFMTGLAAALAAHGVAPERVLSETFGAAAAVAPGVVGDRPAPHPPSGPPGTGPAVTFSASGLTVASCAGEANLLELAEACDVPVSFGCRTGVCHYCETGLLSGEVTYTTEPLEPPRDGRVLVCCARAASDVTLEL